MTGKRVVVDFCIHCRTSINNRVMHQVEHYNQLAEIGDDGAIYDDESQKLTAVQRRINRKGHILKVNNKSASCQVSGRWWSFSILCRMSLDNRVKDQLELYNRMAGFDDDSATYDGEAQKHQGASTILTQRLALGDEKQRCVMTGERDVMEVFYSL